MKRVKAKPERAKKRSKFIQFMKKLLAPCALLICILLVAFISITKRAKIKQEEAIRKKEMEAGPRVQVTYVTQTSGEHTLNLIGETRPYQQVLLYAKVSGYLRDVRVDKGDVVKKGQILAVIESPETDHTYQAALADAINKRTIANRVIELFRRHLVSPQERDQAKADADVSSANLRVQKTLKDYEILRAPFDGTVTARFADPGALIQNASGSGTAALPVVTVSQINWLKVDVFVDQREASYVENDQPVIITLNDPRGKRILGRVSRIADALDPRTKMLLTEIDIPNEKHPLVAGSFVHVALQVKAPLYFMTPVEGLVLKNGKPYLAEVTSENRLTYKPIDIANNDGKVLWISSGVKVGDPVALNVGDTIPEGGKVRPIPETESGA